MLTLIHFLSEDWCCCSSRTVLYQRKEASLKNVYSFLSNLSCYKVGIIANHLTSHIYALAICEQTIQTRSCKTRSVCRYQFSTLRMFSCIHFNVPHLYRLTVTTLELLSTVTSYQSMLRLAKQPLNLDTTAVFQPCNAITVLMRQRPRVLTCRCNCNKAAHSFALML